MVRLPQNWGLGGGSSAVWLDLITHMCTVAICKGVFAKSNLPQLGFHNSEFRIHINHRPGSKVVHQFSGDAIARRPLKSPASAVPG